MAKSQNGWTASATLKTRVLEAVPGVKLRIVDNTNVAYVFDYLVSQYHKRVDDLTKPHPADDWGFNYRPNVNDPNSLSNHSSGTAIDLDATEHPNDVEVRKTFTETQIAEVHQILEELGGTVRWGGDYEHTVDGMHFEINVTPAQLKSFVTAMKKRLAKRDAPTKTEPRSRPSVRALQTALRVKVDNAWGKDTDKAINAVREASDYGGNDFPSGVKFTQQVVGTKQDGRWGPHSDLALRGTTLLVQRAFTAMGYDTGAPDGFWGKRTEAAFQAAKKACHI